VFERYTERARRVIFFARYEASQLGSAVVVRWNEMAAAGQGTDTPGSAEAAHEKADTLHCDAPHGGDPHNGLFARFTERARRVIFFARYETSQLGGAAIETEHLLLGLMREGKGVTSRLFRNRQLSMERVPNISSWVCCARRAG
jgi:ATP-dependent Clp protease ATP-binding subunit ClpA